MDKVAVTRILEQLGPERVERGLPAFRQERFCDIWSECFLGRALGFESTLSACEVADELRAWGDYAVVTHSFDHERPTLRALVEEWLEQNRVPTPSTPHVLVGA